MSIVLDHTIVPSRDKEKSAEFYSRIFGFQDMGEQENEELHGVRMDASSILFFENSSDEDSPWAQGVHHIAFGMDSEKFEQVFARIKSAGLRYGDRYSSPDNMNGPRKVPGAKGLGDSIYFKDPSDNLLQIIRY